MTVKVGINGFGRVGRATFRAINRYHTDELEVTAVNNRTNAKTNAHLLKWDSTYGRYPGEVEATDDSLVVDGKKVRVFNEPEPDNVPWQDYGVDIVVESTGLFTDGKLASGHRKGGAKKVLISAPSVNVDLTLVLGVNETDYEPDKHNVISNASCTTNCIAPVVKVLHESFGLEKALMSTIHAITSEQKIMDGIHKDLRRARTASTNIIPTTTGAAKSVTDVIPELKGRIHGIAFRVPVATVSVIDLVADLTKTVTAEEVNQAFESAAEGPLAGIMEYCREELVSTDFSGNPASAIVDAPGTMVVADNMVKVIAWYDNEWGYSCRLADLAAYVAGKGL